MKTYSLDLRKKIVIAHLVQKMSIRKVSLTFGVSKSLVQKLVKQQQIQGKRILTLTQNMLQLNPTRFLM